MLKPVLCGADGIDNFISGYELIQLNRVCYLLFWLIHCFHTIYLFKPFSLNITVTRYITHIREYVTPVRQHFESLPPGTIQVEL